MYGVQDALMFDLKVYDQFYSLFSVKNAINIADLTSHDGQKGWIDGIFYAFVDHVNLITGAEDMPDEHKISGPV